MGNFGHALRTKQNLRGEKCSEAKIIQYTLGHHRGVSVNMAAGVTPWRARVQSTLWFASPAGCGLASRWSGDSK